MRDERTWENGLAGLVGLVAVEPRPVDEIAKRARQRRSRRVGVLSGAGVVVVVAVASVLASAVALGGGGASAAQPVVASGAAAPATAARYAALTETSYLDRCASGGGTRAYCQCTLSALEAAVPEQEYLRLDNDVQSAASQDLISTISRACGYGQAAAPAPGTMSASTEPAIAPTAAGARYAVATDLP